MIPIYLDELNRMENKIIAKFKISKLKQKQKEENMDDSDDTFYGKTGIQAVKIIKCNNGWIVTIGCATFVTECRKKMFEALSEYWDDPVKAEKKYYKK